MYKTGTADRPVQAIEHDVQSISAFTRYLRLEQSDRIALTPTVETNETLVDLLQLGSTSVAEKGIRNKRTHQSRAASPADCSLVVAGVAAAICGISRTTWYKLRAAGRVPAPIRLGRRVPWRIDELHDWTTAGCPTLHEWKQLRKQRPLSSNRRLSK